MITVKGSKSQPPSASSPKDRFILESMETRSNVPYYVGFFIVTVVAYLKSALDSWAEPHKIEPKGRNAHDPDQNHVQTIDDDVASAASSPAEHQPMDPQVVNEARSAWDGQALSALPTAGVSFLGSDSIALPDPSEQGRGHIAHNEPVKFAAIAVNDNNRTGAGAGTIPHGDGATMQALPGYVTPVRAAVQGGSGGSEDRKNRAPRNVASVELGEQLGSAAILIALTDLLNNTLDPDGNPLYIQELQASSGILTAADGGVNFVPTQTGEVTFTYTITDGELSVTQEATLMVKPNAITGSEGDDVLAGGGFADQISGGAGNDSIGGADGNDIIDGGSGDDTILAGAGDDVVHAGSGNDTVFGGTGNDRLFGEDGNDQLSGEQGNDYLDGGNGNDVLSGGQGIDQVFGGSDDDTIIGDVDAAIDTYDGGTGVDTLDYSRVATRIEVNIETSIAMGADIGTDTISGFEVFLTGAGADLVVASSQAIIVNAGAGDDQVFGSTGNDKLFGGSGNDQLMGAEGNDLLIGGQGADTLDCGGGDDVIVADMDARDDTMAGGLGLDTLDYSASSALIDANFITGIVSGIEIGTDMISGFEAAAFGSGSDHIVVGADPLILSGGGGNDIFEFVIDALSSPIFRNVRHEVTDFMVGDSLKMSKYDVLEDSLGPGSDRFEDVFGNMLDQSQLPIRVRHEIIDLLQQTFVDTDGDGDGTYELTVYLDGQHVLHVAQHI